MSESSQPGYVYILTNPSFKDNWIKIGKTIDIDQRLRQLDNTSTPLPFEVYATLKTIKYSEVEKQLHRIIDQLTDYRIRQNREFFNISPEKALDLLKDMSLTLDDAVLDIKDDSVVFVPAREVVPPHHEVEEDEVRAVSASNWIFPGNPGKFDHSKCITQYGSIYWKSRSRAKEGDIVYLYSAGWDRSIRYKLKVVAAGISYNDKMSRQDEFWHTNEKESDDQTTPRHLLELIDSSPINPITYGDLKDHGLNGAIQGPRTLTGELLDFVEKNFK